MLTFVLSHWLAAALLTLIATAFGLRLLRPLAPDPTAANLALAATLGFGTSASALFILGLAGWLYAGAVAGIAAIMTLLGAPALLELARAAHRLVSQRPSRWAIWVLGAALLTIPLLLLPLYPPTAFDSTMYHLPYARLFIEKHRLATAPLLRYPVFPQLQDLLFSCALLLDGDELAAQLETVNFLLSALLLYGWTRELFNRRAGLLAASLWLGNPIALWVSVNALVEAGLILFATASVYALWRYHRSRRDGWLLIAGACAGWAAATKYHGLFFVVTLAAAAPYLAVRGRQLRTFVLPLLICTALAVPWYARIYYHTGNPFFPLFSALFGESPWSFRHLRPSAEPEAPLESASTLVRILSVPQVIAERAARRALGRAEALLSLSWRPSLQWEQQWPIRFWPPLLLALPAAALLIWKTRRGAVIFFLTIAYILFWFGAARDTRYVLPAAPFVCVLTGAALDRGLAWLALRPQRERAISATLAILALLPSLGLTAVLLQRRGPLPITLPARERFLTQHLKPFGALQYLNRRYGSSFRVYALHAENMVYFARGELVGDWIGPYRYGLILPKLGDTAALYHQLRALGANFLLVRSDVGPYGSWRPSGPAAGDFRLVYADRWTRIFKLRS